MFKVFEWNILTSFYTYLGTLRVLFAHKHTVSGGLSKMDVNLLQNRLIPNNWLLDPVLFFRSVVLEHTINHRYRYSQP